jgi:hypothetical protein
MPDADQPQERRIMNVKVRNDNGETFTDEFSGKTYVFAAGKTISLPLEAAKHIFGYNVKGADDRTMFDHVCKRWGWNTPANVTKGFQEIKEIWSKFTFTPVVLKMVEVPAIDTAALADNRDEAARPEDQDYEIPDLKLGEPTIRATA